MKQQYEAAQRVSVREVFALMAIFAVCVLLLALLIGAAVWGISHALEALRA